ncbi:PTS sugar transporter subunit IIA [Clostridium sp. Marseille-P2415]|uniref:PTS sugar transporter subunit IIA n=1 Tax=Clostridium sp. Marseille-P2415 TaxID=1805471 RepID=UPI0009883163|nr:PTS glucose transporter subunit IIA [Clostridium sp. Marseille-P2415]
MFSRLFGGRKEKEKAEGRILAVQSGNVVSIEEVPDPVFSQKVLGDGVAIIPEEGKIYSPVDGTVDNVMDTGHALAIVAEDGAQILIHIGLETVELKGEGFKPHVTGGQKVHAGDLLMEVDLELLKSRGYNMITPVLILNQDSFQELIPCTGMAKAGETVIISYH